MLRKTPFVTTVAVLSLGLGIGANTAIFALFNQILLRPLPVESPEALVNLGAPGVKNGSNSCNNSGDCDAVFSYPMFLDLARDQQVFTGIAAHRIFGANVGYDNQTLPVDGIEVSGSYFQRARAHAGARTADRAGGHRHGRQRAGGRALGRLLGHALQAAMRTCSARRSS